MFFLLTEQKKKAFIRFLGGSVHLFTRVQTRLKVSVPICRGLNVSCEEGLR